MYLSLHRKMESSAKILSPSIHTQHHSLNLYSNTTHSIVEGQQSDNPSVPLMPCKVVAKEKQPKKTARFFFKKPT